MNPQSDPPTVCGRPPSLGNSKINKNGEEKMMRIITGIARGMKLETPAGDATRPTDERVKEAVFSMIQFEIEGRRVLDLFAGSGQLGLETLSRGAQSAVFVDADKAATDVIKRNAQKVKLYDKCNVLTTDYKLFIRGAKNAQKFDIIFLDPPYGSDMMFDALKRICDAGIVEANGIIVCESDRETPIVYGGLELVRHARYGKKYISLLRNVGE